MYTPADKSQFLAWAIKQGKHKLAPAHQEITDWLTNQFGVTALEFSCEKKEPAKGSPQQLVHVILNAVEDVKKIQADRAKNILISERFLEYFKSAATRNNASDPLKTDVFPVDTSPFPEIIVTYRPLKELDKKVVEEMLDDEKRAILKTFESVWTMSQAVIFYHTDAQVKENLANGTSEKINEALKRVGIKFGIDEDSPYRFDSKESFDRDYESNWYYYWK